MRHSGPRSVAGALLDADDRIVEAMGAAIDPNARASLEKARLALKRARARSNALTEVATMLVKASIAFQQERDGDADGLVNDAQDIACRTIARASDHWKKRLHTQGLARSVP